MGSTHRRRNGTNATIAGALAVAGAAVLSGIAGAAGCSSSDHAQPSAADASTPDATTTLPASALEDPTSCATCHAQHYGQWSSSMHAYASVDPLFVAMNRRAQRETGGALGNFCTQCHAPMAVRAGASSDGGAIDTTTLPAAQNGVTCYFCHSVSGVNGTSDDPLALASDGVLRGPITDPVANAAHASVYSSLHDQAQPAASSLCGACHDVTIAGGPAIETTFAEWKTSLYAHDTVQSLETCGGCHMSGSLGTAASPPNLVPTRTVHDHSTPGLDLARTPFPDVDAQAALVQASLDTAVGAQLCVSHGPSATGPTTLTVTLDNGFVGHDWPSGAVHDRRAWVEIVATDDSETTFSSGVVPNDQTSVETIGDPNLWLFKETLFDANQNPVLFMWQATSASLTALPPVTTSQPGATGFDNGVTKTYTVLAAVDDVKMRVRILPVAVEVVQSLITSGDLDPSYLTGLEALTLSGTQLEWNLTNDGYGCVP